MPDHNGHLVSPSQLDRNITNDLLNACISIRELIEADVDMIISLHLFLESESIRLGWILAHVREAEKELKNLKEIVDV